MINLRGWVVIALVCAAWATGVRAESGRSAYTCSDIKAAVATIQQAGSVSRGHAIEILTTAAKSQGVKPAEIEAARKCLSS